MLTAGWKGLTLCLFFYIFKKMGLKKYLLGGFIPLFLCTFLFSQSLPELAKKERERRNRLQGKKSILVTNATLTRLKKKPAILVSPSATPEKKPLSITPKRKSPRQISPKARGEEADKRETQDARSNLEEQLTRAKDYVELLSLRINALWQEYYSLDDRTSQEKILRKINEAALDLEKAREEEAKISKEFKKLRKD